MGSSSKLTTVRIPQELYDVISKEARDRDVGFNTILNQILRKYAEWDKPAQRVGMLSIPREGVVDLLDSANKSKLHQAASKFQESLRELASMLEVPGGRNLLGLLNGLCNYGGLGTISTKPNGRETNIIHLRHGLGWRVSSFLVNFAKSYENDLDVNTKEQENSITIEIKKRNPKKKA